MSTSMNTIGLCKTKENILETIANWLSLLNHNFVVNALALLLLNGAFFLLADLITSCNYKNWYGRCIKKDPWIPIQHLEQMQWLFSDMSKLANTLAVIQKAIAGTPLDPAPFVCLYNTASDLVRDIE
eukprot:5611927-Ditylum_brightwellii.AAC.1